MKTNIIYRVIILLSIITGSYVINLAAQDSTGVNVETIKKQKVNPDSAKVSQDEFFFGEIELMEITIEAVIEKPRVSILPKRLEPKLEEIEFVNRSFEMELKQGPDTPLLIDKRAQTPDKIKQLKTNNRLKKNKENKENIN